MSRRPPESDTVRPAETPLQRALRVGHERQHGEDASIDAMIMLERFENWLTPEVRMTRMIFHVFNSRRISRDSLVYLVDGSNVFYKKPYLFGPVLEAVEGNGGVEGPCIVVSNSVTLKYMKKEENYQAVRDTLAPITGKKYPILFCHLNVIKCGPHNNGHRCA